MVWLIVPVVLVLVLAVALVWRSRRAASVNVAPLALAAPVVFDPGDPLEAWEDEADVLADGALSFDGDPEFDEDSMAGIDLSGLRRLAVGDLESLQKSIEDDEARHKQALEENRRRRVNSFER